jgi:hypothetical protein
MKSDLKDSLNNKGLRKSIRIINKDLLNDNNSPDAPSSF